MGTALFSWFGVDVVSLWFKITPGGAGVQLGLRTTAIKAYNVTTIETAQAMLRELEDLMITLWAGTERKRTTTAQVRIHKTRAVWHSETAINLLLDSESKTMLYCMLKSNNHLLLIFPLIFIGLFKMHTCMLVIIKKIHIHCRKIKNHYKKIFLKVTFQICLFKRYENQSV